MLMSGTLHRLLLAATCLCVYGNPVQLRNFTPTQDCDGQCASSGTTVGSTHATDVKPEPSDTEHDGTDLMLNVGAGGGAGPHGRPEGIAAVTQTGNGDSLDGRSGPSEAAGEAWSQRSGGKKVDGISEMGDAQRQTETDSSVDPEASPQLSITGREDKDQSGTDPPAYGDSVQDKDPETSSTEPPDSGAPIQKLTSHMPPLFFVSPRTSTHLSVWGHDAATSLPDPLLPEIGPNLMPREDGPESLWTEAARPGG
ncbi:uncharacterized protein LOC121963358, partial [Plectropomus leopardus]|uniref:uncharacterized protein LOC121963358 n=1 Tax=Plectropomus leopardus TaxID=160734 RepID=UPI001C4AA258